MPNAINFDDYRRLAKRRLPRIIFDFIEGGVDGEDGLQRNVQAFRQRCLLPRYMVDVSTIDTAVTLFGRRYAQPFGIAPTGAIGAFRAGGDAMLARAAAAANIPFVLSGAASATIEDIATVAPETTWFQLYIAKDRRISEDMVQRAIDAGFPVLMVTVDVPGQVRRERNIRNGFSIASPLNPSWSARLEALRHPAWVAEYLRGPGLRAAIWEKYAPVNRPTDVLRFLGTQMPASATWDDIAWIRKKWPRPLIVKGVMHPKDVTRLVAMGVDGILLSNHGGRQLDRSPAPLDLLPAVLEATSGKIPVLFDSGIRRGADIATAMAMGAAFCLLGRWTLYALVAGGEPAVRSCISLINQEITAVMAQLGAASLAALDKDHLH